MRDSTFSSFGNIFQNKIIQSLIIDQQFFEKIFDILLLEYFDQKPQAYIYKLILDYYEKYKILPSIQNLDILIRSINDEILKEECFLVLNQIRKDPVSDLTYVKDKVLEFCKNQKMKKALLLSVDYLQQGKFDEIYKIIKDALNAGESSELGHNYFEHFDKRMTLMNRSSVSTGWPVLDKILNGGWGKGELAVFLGGTSIGKSWCLVYAGKGALDKGKTVMHYSFELYEHTIGGRYDAVISKFPINQIKLNEAEVKRRMLEYASGTKGKLLIKNYPAKTANVNTIRNHLNKLAHYNIIPDLIVVDYADLMNSRKHYEQKRYELESIYEDLRAMACELQIPIITGSQSNRGSIDDEVVTLSSIGESYAKAQVADIIISISRRYEDKLQNKGKMFVAKNRAGQDGIVLPIIMNTSIAQIEVMEPQDIDPNIEFSDKQKIEETLKFLYEKINKKKKVNGE